MKQLKTMEAMKPMPVCDSHTPDLIFDMTPFLDLEPDFMNITGLSALEDDIASKSPK
jgi:hypothetical protein